MKMYRCLLYFFCMILFACNSNKNPYANNRGIDPSEIAQIDTAHYTLIKWQDSLINFGTIKSGDSVHIKYRFTNVGNTPLFIIDARASCGCTVTDYPKDPVMPGKSSFILATLRSGVHVGEVNKSIVVISNTRNKTRHLLSLRGEVLPLKK